MGPPPPPPPQADKVSEANAGQVMVFKLRLESLFSVIGRCSPLQSSWIHGCFDVYVCLTRIHSIAIVTISQNYVNLY